jgi:hypothetical protein
MPPIMWDGIENVLELPACWRDFDPRIPTLLPEIGRIHRISEHATLDGGVVTRAIEVAVRQVDPLDELDRLAGAVSDLGLELAIHDGGLAGSDGDLWVLGQGGAQSKFELRFQIERAHEGDLRGDIPRYPVLERFAALAELSNGVTRIACSHVLGRAPHAMVAVSLDDDSRHCVTAWLAAQGFVHDRDGMGAWRRHEGPMEHAVSFKRVHEIDLDEATAAVHPVPFRIRARGTGDHRARTMS